MWRIYKEGQGGWARGLVATVIVLGALFGVTALYGALPESDADWSFLGWSLDYRSLVGAPILIGAAVFAVWLFNRPPTADFLIETENELKNKVVWPSKEEEIKHSIVVLVTVVLFMVFILGVDSVFQVGRQVVYDEEGLKEAISLEAEDES